MVLRANVLPWLRLRCQQVAMEQCVQVTGLGFHTALVVGLARTQLA